MNTLPKPLYIGSSSSGIGLAVESMKKHTSDEGWILFQALQENGYQLAGHNLEIPSTDVLAIVSLFKPGIVVVQDKREYDGRTAGGLKGFDERERFTNVQYLRDRSDIFKLTILKDAQHNPEYHAESAREIGCHAWIVYYEKAKVKSLAPYVREEHLIRTYHSINKDLVPEYTHPERRAGCFFSGAISPTYPLRQRILREMGRIPGLHYEKHPGYHRNGCHTPDYLKKLSRHKIAICTASIYGYALRKIIEATACGCIVITNLPESDKLPEIDGNLIRVDSEISVADLGRLVRSLYDKYNPVVQRDYIERAKNFYDYRESGRRLVIDIEMMRQLYNVITPENHEMVKCGWKREYAIKQRILKGE